jgi:hypothetical protein
MNEEWTALDDAIEEVREGRRQLWAEFDNDPVKFHEHLMEYQKQFGDRLITSPEQLAPPSRKTEDPGKSAA